MAGDHAMTHPTALPAPAGASSTSAPSLTAHAALAGWAALVALVVFGVPALLAAAVLPAAQAARIDLAARLLPDLWVGLSAALALGGAAHVGRTGLAAGLWAVALAGAVMLIVHLVAPAALGFGDVKFAAALAPVPAAAAVPAVGTIGALGTAALTTAVMLFVASGLVVVVGAVRRRAELPLGPALMVGSAVSAAVAAQGLLVR